MALSVIDVWWDSYQPPLTYPMLNGTWQEGDLVLIIGMSDARNQSPSSTPSLITVTVTEGPIGVGQSWTETRVVNQDYPPLNPSGGANASYHVGYIGPLSSAEAAIWNAATNATEAGYEWPLDNVPEGPLLMPGLYVTAQVRGWQLGAPVKVNHVSDAFYDGVTDPKTLATLAPGGGPDCVGFAIAFANSISNLGTVFASFSNAATHTDWGGPSSLTDLYCGNIQSINGPTSGAFTFDWWGPPSPAEAYEVLLDVGPEGTKPVPSLRLIRAEAGELPYQLHTRML